MPEAKQSLDVMLFYRRSPQAPFAILARNLTAAFNAAGHRTKIRHSGTNDLVLCVDDMTLAIGRLPVPVDPAPYQALCTDSDSDTTRRALDEHRGALSIHLTGPATERSVAERWTVGYIAAMQTSAVAPPDIIHWSPLARLYSFDGFLRAISPAMGGGKPAQPVPNRTPATKAPPCAFARSRGADNQNDVPADPAIPAPPDAAERLRDRVLDLLDNHGRISSSVSSGRARRTRLELDDLPLKRVRKMH